MNIHNLLYCSNRTWSPLSEDDPRCKLLVMANGWSGSVGCLHPCSSEDCPTGKYHMKEDNPALALVESLGR